MASLRKSATFSTRLKTGKNGTIFRNGLSLIQSKGLVFSPISRNRFRVTRKFPAFVETVRSNCLIPDTPSTRLFANTIDILRNRNALKYDPTKRIGYSILCKAARISMETDIRNHKERLIEKAIKEGKNLRKAKEKGHFMRKRMESRDESGEYSQAHTTKRVQTFYNRLYQPCMRGGRLFLLVLDCFLSRLESLVEKARQFGPLWKVSDEKNWKSCSK